MQIRGKNVSGATEKISFRGPKASGREKEAIRLGEIWGASWIFVGQPLRVLQGYFTSKYIHISQRSSGFRWLILEWEAIVDVLFGSRGIDDASQEIERGDA